jgi:hypothetical protein
VTCKVPVVVREMPPLVPVTLIVNVPRGFVAVLIVRMDATPGATAIGENEPDDPGGRPLTDSDTDPTNPFRDVTVTV